MLAWLLVVPLIAPSLQSVWTKEFLGTIAMIGLTFSPGTWFGESTFAIYTLHAAGVIVADKFFGGDVNPAVSTCMYSLGKSNLPTYLTKVSAQLLGGIFSFFIFSLLSKQMELTVFGGPVLPKNATDDAVEICVMNELTGTLILLYTIFAVNWEFVFLPNAEHNYYVKQSLTAAAIRMLIITFPNSGPSINPMLATAYAIHNGSPITANHVLVYWFAPFIGACIASLTYVLYTGGEGAKFFGVSLKTVPRDKSKPVLNIAPVKKIPNTKLKEVSDKTAAATPPPTAAAEEAKEKKKEWYNPGTWSNSGKKKNA